MSRTTESSQPHCPQVDLTVVHCVPIDGSGSDGDLRFATDRARTEPAIWGTPAAPRRASDKGGRLAAAGATGGSNVEAEFGVAGEAFGVHAGEDGDDDVDVVVDLDVVLVSVSS